MSTRARTCTLATLAVTLTALLAPVSATAAVPGPPNPTPPDSVTELNGFGEFWTAANYESTTPFAGTVQDAEVLARNDEIVTWINNYATNPDQAFSALQASARGSEPDGYNPSVTMGLGMGETLGGYYIDGLKNQQLPDTVTLVDSNVGVSATAADYGTPKDAYAYPRPYLTLSTDEGVCASPEEYNSDALESIRPDELAWVASPGDLDLRYWDNELDETFMFAKTPVWVGPNYDGNCNAGSFPSGHATYAYEAAIMLAVLLPELAPELLTRASEIGMDRLVLGMHYPLDVIGGRMIAMSGISTQLNDPAFYEAYVVPAREELRAYLEAQCGSDLQTCIDTQSPYTSNPFDGAQMPGGSAQIVTDRASAVAVYTERMTYGFDRIGESGHDIEVPSGAQVLLQSVFPDLTSEQRTSVLAQTAIDSGYPLAPSDDGATGSDWQRVNLAAAMSATVQVNADASVTVVAVGGRADVIRPGDVSGPQTVTGGETASFEFSGFLADEEVEITLSGPAADAATLAMIRPRMASTTSILKTAATDGSVSVAVTLPVTASGAYTLTAAGLSSGVTVSIDVTAVPGDLPATGGSPLDVVEISGAVALLSFGLVLVAIQRHRRT